MHGDNLVIARAPVIFRDFPSFSSSESTALTYFQVVATEEIFLRFNGCENMFKVKSLVVYKPFKEGGVCYTTTNNNIYYIYIIIKKKTEGDGVCVGSL